MQKKPHLTGGVRLKVVPVDRRHVRFPTLVLPRSGCEGRPIIRTLSLMAPLAIIKIVCSVLVVVNGLLGLPAR